MLNADIPYSQHSAIPFDWLEQSSIGVLVLDEAFNCLHVNALAKDLFWPDINNVTVLPSDALSVLLPYIDKLLSQSDSVLTSHLSLHSQVYKADFAEIESQSSTRKIFITLRSSCRNINYERELKVFRNAVENTGSAVLITDHIGLIEYANPRFSEITGYDLTEIKGQNPAFLRSKETDESIYKALWSTVLNHKPWRGTLLNQRKNGSTYWSMQNISPIHDEQGEITNFVSVSEDISHIKEHDAELQKMAYFDPLTELGNRRSFRRTLDQYLLHPNHGDFDALLLLDLDHFKQINDTMGHEAGDALLTTIASRLQFCSHPGTSVFRLGGDEFTLILDSCYDRADIQERVKEILFLLAQPIQIGPHELNITVSIGVTLIGVDSVDASDLLRNADLAMYHAKKKGRNTFAFYAEHLNDEAQRILTIEHDLRSALAGQQLYLNYQPQVDAQDGRITAIEALLRWNHPVDGNVPPGQFIAHAEETGLIIPIGRWVLEEACRAAKSLQDQGLPPLKVCVNLSARQFDDPALIQHITQALEKADLAAEWLELEITESMLMRDMTAAINTLNQIKKMGISLAIDDFGTGYSSLSYLTKIPVDLLKIDRSFLQKIPQDKDNMTITSTIIAMTKQLGLCVVAEGVENNSQMHFLQQQECNTMQGFLVSRPLSFADFNQIYSQSQHITSSQAAFIEQPRLNLKPA